MTQGSVAGIWRYPVKSMQGEALESSWAGERGLLGDRAYAVLDRETGTIASAKHPRKWAALFACRAAYAEPPRPGAALPPVVITLPDGAAVSSADPAASRALSELVGREVTLTSEAPPERFREADRRPLDGADEAIRREPLALGAPAGTFFDYAPLHLLTTATLAHFQARYPAGRFAPRRFRPNLLFAPPAGVEGLVEHDWLGLPFVLGDGLALRVIDPTPRCLVPTLAQGDLPRDPGILRAITEHSAAPGVTLAPGVLFPAVAGVYAAVTRAGLVRVGDSLTPTAPGL
jgi:uncharacterized protein YcbX